MSKALNDDYDISNQTKLKIRKLAKSNNYIPNSMALALRSKKTKIITVIVPEIIGKKSFDLLLSKINN